MTNDELRSMCERAIQHGIGGELRWIAMELLSRLENPNPQGATLMELTAEKRAPIVDKLTQQIEHLLTFPYSTTERARRIAYKLTYAIESVIAATSAPATIKAGDEVAPGVKAYVVTGGTNPSELITAAMAQRDAELAALREKLAEAEKYKALWQEGIDCVDRVFQVDSTKPEPLLPDFLPAGAHKFKGVIKLAEAYIKSESSLAELRAAVDKYSMQARHTTDGAFVYGRGWRVLGEGKTFSAACLAAHRAENAEVKHG